MNEIFVKTDYAAYLSDYCLHHSKLFDRFNSFCNYSLPYSDCLGYLG